MRSALVKFLTSLLSITSFYSYADDADNNNLWKGNIDVGYISSMGSTSGSKETFRGKTSASYNGTYWVQTVSAEGISVRDEVPATNDTERYLAS